MPEVIITYETLYELLRREKYRKELQKFDKNFFQNVIRYLEEKKSILNSQKTKTSIFASSEVKKTQKTLENIQRILKELYERRETKIIQLALFASRINEKQDGSVMLPQEVEMYKNLLNTLNTYREGILHNILSTKLPTIIEKPKEIKVEKKDNTKLVKFIYATPKFMGDDLHTYGPFEEEDLVNLPETVTKVLLKNKRVEEIKI